MGNAVQPTRSTSNFPLSLEGFRDAVENEVKRLIEWYDAKNKWKKKCSIFYRGATILCSTVGLLIPVLAPLIPETWRTNAYHWGYVFALLAVFFITIDRQFNLTSSWVRTLKAERQLQTALWEFRAKWFRFEVSTPRTSDEAFAECVKEFLLKARSIVDQEADTWATETLASLSQLEKATVTGAEEARKRYEAAVETMRFGAIEVTVTNLPQSEWWYSVSLNGQIRKPRWRAPVCGIIDVVPGNVEVLVEAEMATGKKFIGAKTVAVVSGAPIAVTVDLSPIA